MVWNIVIGGVVGGGGIGLQEQQMSWGDIFIIVDVCISFVIQYGFWLEGVYWKGGVCVCSLKFLVEFCWDVWLVKF